MPAPRSQARRDLIGYQAAEVRIALALLAFLLDSRISGNIGVTSGQNCGCFALRQKLQVSLVWLSSKRKKFSALCSKTPKKNSYIERLAYGDCEPQRETKLCFVQEEWQFAIFYANAGVMQRIPIVRAGEPGRMAALPLGVSPDNGFDMRDPADYPRQVRFAAWDGEHALIKLGLKDWVMTCISWCCENYPGCAEKWVDAWPIDLLRPRLFLDRVFQTSACSQAQ